MKKPNTLQLLEQTTVFLRLVNTSRLLRIFLSSFYNFYSYCYDSAYASSFRSSSKEYPHPFKAYLQHFKKIRTNSVHDTGLNIMEAQQDVCTYILKNILLLLNLTPQRSQYGVKRK